MVSVSFDRCASLKAHKALPRGRTVSTEIPSASKFQSTGRNLTVPNVEKERIAAWINDSSSPLANPNRHLPLTPPLQPLDTLPDGKYGRILVTVGKSELAHKDTPFDSPVNHRSPPTPELTPPRKRSRQKTNLSPPPPNLRYPSRTDSFKTAFEQLPPYDRTPSPQQQVSSDRDSTVTKRYGLGLGLDGDGAVPAPFTPLKTPEIRIIEGSPGPGFGGSLHIVQQDPLIAVTTAAVQETRLTATPYRWSQVTPSENFGGSLSERGPALNMTSERRDESKSGAASVHATQATRSSRQERSGPVDAVVQHAEAENKCLSETSVSSAVVEAILVESPPRLRQKLRHSSKNHSLRAMSSSQNASNRSSLISSEGKPRFAHRQTKIADRRDCASTSSDCGVSIGSGALLRPHINQLQATVISKRRLSRKSSEGSQPLLDSHVHTVQRSMCLAEAPDSAMRLPNGSRPKTQIHPDSASSTTSRDLRGVRQGDRRSSPLSATGNRNDSRAASMVSISINKRCEPRVMPQQQQQKQQKQQQQQQQQHQQQQKQPAITFVAENPLARLDSTRRSVEEEWSGLPPRSTLLTPFSGISIKSSSTPGIYELHEATAVNIFPHTNKSVLVVQQSPRQNTATYQDNVRVAINGPQSTPVVHRSRYLVDSPLQNPRNPPQPPALKVAPPTPAESTPAAGHRPRQGVVDLMPGNRPLSVVRRALSGRRHSETFVSQLPKLMGRRNTARERPAVNVENLSPSWKPRGIWDDLSDSEDDVQEVGDYFTIRNTLGMPQKPIAAGPLSLARRLGSLNMKRRSTTSRNKSIVGPNLVREEDDDHAGGEGDGVEREGASMRIPGLGNLHGMLQSSRDKRQGREMVRQEKKRALLRSKIGATIFHPDARTIYYAVDIERNMM